MSKKGLLGELLNSAKKAEIGHGIHNKCVILTVNNNTKKTKDGVVIKRNNFTVVGQLNDSNKVVAEKEISWFNIDVTSDYAYDNLSTQIEQMVGILDCYYEITEEKDFVAEKINSIFEEFEVGSIEEVKDLLDDQKTFNNFMSKFSETYMELLEDKIGIDSDNIRVKLTFDSKGKYLQQPRYDAFTEPISIPEKDSKLKISTNEEQYRVLSENPTAGSGAPKTNI